VGAWAPSLGATGGRLFDHSLFGNHGTLTDMDPASDWVVSGGKGALDFDGTNDYVLVSDSKGLIAGSSNFTISAWSFAPSGLGQINGGRAIYCERGASGNGILKMDSYTSSPAADGLLLTYRNDSGNIQQTLFEPGADHRGRWIHAAITFSNGNTFLFYINGVQTNSLSWANNNTLTSANQTWISGDAQGPNSRFSGQLDDIRIYNRTLSAKEIRTLSLRRGIAFERGSRKLSVSSAAAPTGSVSSTLANATLSSSGTLASGSTGLLSSTLADATLSATGTVSAGASGSVARTLDAATLSSSGTIGSGLTGSVSASLGAATLSSSGTLAAGASGSVTRTLDSATLSSSGTVAAGASGTVTRTLDNATLSATGGAAGTVTGSVSSTLAAVTCSSSGTLAAGLSGTVVRTLDSVTSSATGTVTNGASGTVTRTLANATLASGGSLSAGLTAQVNRALESCVVSSSGTLASGLTGTLSVQLASATLQSGNIAVGGLRIKVGGEWKNANAFVKVTGTWKNATPFVKVSGVWK
jgi:hypothetical protein